MTDKNAPMFPTMEHGTDSVGCPCITTQPGLTKREYFSAMALQGMLAAFKEEWELTGIDFADAAVLAADNLINALNKSYSINIEKP